MKNLSQHTVDDVILTSTKGPWPTKSGGELEVLFAVDHRLVYKIFTEYKPSSGGTKKDIRGIRVYRISGLKKGAAGANEWHRLRYEVVIVTKGSFRWSVMDLQGDRKDFIIDPMHSVLNPPFILHNYEALEENSELLVIANTLFNPDDKSTHDSYSHEQFQKVMQDSVGEGLRG